jgi:hypothetical protein
MAERTPLSRPFGRAAEDLEFDFSSADRPALVTALLAACAVPTDAGHWWRQPVSARTEALLALLHESEGGELLALTIRCEAVACGARFEIELPYAALTVGSAAGGTIEVQRDDGGPLSLRLPTGEDLRAWRAWPSANRERAADAVLATLRVAGELRPDDEARAAAALTEADPLVAFSVFCACPSCGHDAEREVDLEDVVLQRLAARQRALLREVHALASRYGWTECDILAVAPARRARYLELIEAWA